MVRTVGLLGLEAPVVVVEVAVAVVVVVVVEVEVEVEAFGIEVAVGIEVATEIEVVVVVAFAFAFVTLTTAVIESELGTVSVLIFVPAPVLVTARVLVEAVVSTQSTGRKKILMEDKARELKEKGNEAFKNKNWSEAISFFTQAIEIDTTNEIYYSNRSAAYIFMKQYKEALDDANRTIELKPNWSRGYQRKGTTLYLMCNFQESQQVFERGLVLDPENPTIKSGCVNSIKAQKLNQVIPKGIIAPVPIAFTVDEPHNILWDCVDRLVDWYTNSGVSCLWACSPASEYTHLSNEECIQFASRIVERSKYRNMPVISGLRPQNSLTEYAEQIKNIYSTGVNAVVIDLCSLGTQQDTEQTITSNLLHLLDLIGDIPVGIYEARLPYQRLFSSSLLKSVASLAKVSFYIDTCGSVKSLQVFVIVNRRKQICDPEMSQEDFLEAQELTHLFFSLKCKHWELNYHFVLDLTIRVERCFKAA
eukprot:TRINITY_DN8959_c0_g2_i7.p1 TRINITY_DN8959_c0_g2~~TRINITY_DN8959_c0_g2_i7.p1  ORF type:complete len:476 (-),score=71.83 TRINITY_DN8959_c0_g2_i7:441-1868(-)